jgi:hypothetical protein
MLLAAARNGWADENAWAEVVRVALTVRGGWLRHSARS